MASRQLDGVTASTNYEDATIGTTGSIAGDDVYIVFDDTSDPADVIAAYDRGIAIITQLFANRT